jgi:eukaryotic-like serine/threonine-protein kinase
LEETVMKALETVVTPAAPLLRKAPMKVGRYEILEIIGAGANGSVVRAHDPMIGRLVAIKLLPPELAKGEAQNRFLQEARVVGQLSHPSIITLHDMGIEESTSTPYLVMEFLTGQSLDRILDKGAVPTMRACAWIGDVAGALTAAHRKGVIHGDVKPANILITEDGRVKLMDFGMARVAAREQSSKPLSGTPAYWCPEQIMGQPQDGRSDLFSLGVVLYELLTRKRPFDADSLQGVCNRILSHQPLPVSHLNTSLPSAMNDVVTRCLSKDPNNRYPSGEELADDLYPFARRRSTGPAVGRATKTPAQGLGSYTGKYVHS